MLSLHGGGCFEGSSQQFFYLRVGGGVRGDGSIKVESRVYPRVSLLVMPGCTSTELSRKGATKKCRRHASSYAQRPGHEKTTCEIITTQRATRTCGPHPGSLTLVLMKSLETHKYVRALTTHGAPCHSVIKQITGRPCARGGAPDPYAADPYAAHPCAGAAGRRRV